MRRILLLLIGGLVAVFAQNPQEEIRKICTYSENYIAVSINGQIHVYDTSPLHLVSTIDIHSEGEEEHKYLRLVDYSDKKSAIHTKPKEKAQNSLDLKKEQEEPSKYLQNIQGNEPNAIIVGETILIREKRIAVEHINLFDHILVIVYTDTVTKMITPEETGEHIKREIKCLLGKTYINQKHRLYNIIIDITTKTKGSKVYLIKMIHGSLYLSEVYLSEIQEENENLGKTILNYLTIVLFSILIGFLILPIITRVYISRRCAVEIVAKKQYMAFKHCILFKTTPAYAIEIDKSSPEEMELYKGIVLLREIDRKDCIVYIEETERYIYIAYHKDIISITDNSAVYTEIEKCAIIHRIMEKIEKIHSSGYFGIGLGVEDVFIRKGDQRLSFISLKSLRKIDVSKKDEQCAEDYKNLGILFYRFLISSTENMGISRHLDISAKQIQNIVRQHEYRKYPKWRIESRSQRTLEALDCINLLINGKYTEKKEAWIHPLFWSLTQRFEFLALLSDYIFDHPIDRVIESSKLLEATEIDYSKWTVYIPKPVLDALTRNGKYYYNSKALRDLYRIIRNNGRHFQSIPEDGQEFFQRRFPDYFAYFQETYPYLILFGYNIAVEHSLFEKKVFQAVKLDAIHM
ncbi:hypothetical protein NEFER03_1900 [Nematocida sp. LUAm3]|nr:hypothetical protein NEFER03_1900 [Nematocida sp. LUAm3]KAI5173949.1 hypothetical protein NEFER02_0416 [Nematocida sp. LUAm2]KAI5177306.1 hypothetical protein NEFER01_0581 [Nematocida sp. LUAm1]